MNDKIYTEDELAYIDRLMTGGMDRTRAEYYLHIMQTVPPEDLRRASDAYIESLGGLEITKEFVTRRDELLKSLGLEVPSDSAANNTLIKEE